MNDERAQVVLDYVDRQVLKPGETLLWKGRADPIRTAGIETRKFLTGLAGLAFGLFWTYSLGGKGNYAIFDVPVLTICGAIILAISGWKTSGPIRTYLRASRTFYAITDKSIVIVTAGIGYTVKVLKAQDLTHYERIDCSDGGGSIRLRRSQDTSGDASGKSEPVKTVSFDDGLWGIPDLKGAARAIAQLRAAEALAVLSRVVSGQS